jgi:transcription initiation factor TFIIIB Brf1 subunit/transcription initiation factor TFIIB
MVVEGKAPTTVAATAIYLLSLTKAKPKTLPGMAAPLSRQ